MVDRNEEEIRKELGKSNVDLEEGEEWEEEGNLNDDDDENSARCKVVVELEDLTYSIFYLDGLR
jgi:hypothetical protein